MRRVLSSVAPMRGEQSKPPFRDKYPDGIPLRNLKEGDRLEGKVVTILNRKGIIFDVGCQRDGLMPLRFFEKRLPRLNPGDRVKGLRVVSVDLENFCFVLGGANLEIVEQAVVPRGRKGPSRLTAPSEGRTLDEFETGTELGGTVVVILTGIGILFDVGAVREALLPLKLFGKEIR